MVNGKRRRGKGIDDEAMGYLNELDNPDEGYEQGEAPTEEHISKYKKKYSIKNKEESNLSKDVKKFLQYISRKVVADIFEDTLDEMPDDEYQQEVDKIEEILLSKFKNKDILETEKELENMQIDLFGKILKNGDDDLRKYNDLRVIVLYKNILKKVKNAIIKTNIKSLMGEKIMEFKEDYPREYNNALDKGYIIGKKIVIGIGRRRKVKGGRFVDDLFNPSKVLHELKKIPKLPKTLADKAINEVKKVLQPDYSNYPEPSKKVLNERGNWPIIALEVNRTPLGTPIKGLINALTLGKFKEGQQASGYDKFFHLALIATVRNPSGGQQVQVVMQKNARVEITKTFKSDNNTEYLQVPLKNIYITPNELLEMTRKRIGDNKFFRYDSFAQNCQIFIKDILESIKLYGKKEADFIYQDTSEIVKKIPSWNREMMNWTTDAGNVFSKITGTGKGRRRRTAPKLRGGKLNPCPTGYTDFGLTCTRCSWNEGCKTIGKVDWQGTKDEVVQGVKKGTEVVGKVVKKAFDKFGSMTKEAFMAIYEDIKKKHPEIAKIEQGFDKLIKVSKLTVANKDWWNKTMTTPDTYIFLVSTAFTIASLAGVPGAGTLSSATKILGDLAQGRPIKMSDINSLALSLIPVPGGAEKSVGLFDKVKTAMIGAKGLTAAQRAAVIGKNIVTAQNALLDVLHPVTVPNAFAKNPSSASTNNINDSMAEMSNVAYNETKKNSGAIVPYHPSNPSNPNNPNSPPGPSNPPGTQTYDPSQPNYVPPPPSVPKFIQQNFNGKWKQGVDYGDRKRPMGDNYISGQGKHYRGRGIDFNNEFMKIMGGANRAFNNMALLSMGVCPHCLDNKLNLQIKKRKRTRRGGALKPCDSGYTDFGLTCTRCETKWAGIIPYPSCNTVSKVDWAETGREIARAFQPVTDAFDKVKQAFDRFGAMTKEAFVALGATLQARFGPGGDISNWCLTAFAPLINTVGNEDWWKKTMTTPDTYISLVCMACTVASLAGVPGAGTLGSCIKIIGDLAQGRDLDLNDVAGLLLGLMPAGAGAGKTATWLEKGCAAIAGANAEERMYVIGKNMVTAGNAIAKMTGKTSIGIGQDDSLVVNIWTQSNMEVENGETQVSEANRANGVVPPPAPPVEIPPPLPVVEIDPSKINQCSPYGIKLGKNVNGLQSYTPAECSAMGGVDYGNGECLAQDGSGSFSYNCRENTDASKITPCSPYGQRLGVEKDGLRFYTPSECSALGGIDYGNGECLDPNGGSFSWNCADAQNPAPAPAPTAPTATPEPRPERQLRPGVTASGNQSGLVIHSVNIRNTVPLVEAKRIARDIMKTKNDRYHRETKNWIRFRNIPKTKFKLKTYVTKKINKDIEIIFGKLK